MCRQNTDSFLVVSLFYALVSHTSLLSDLENKNKCSEIGQVQVKMREKAADVQRKTLKDVQKSWRTMSQGYF